MRKWLALGLLALAGAVEAQPLTGGLLGRGASYTSFVPPASAATGCVGIFLGSPLNLQCAPSSGIVYTVATKSFDVTDGRVQAGNLTAIPLPASGSVTVTPVLSKVGTITTVAGASLADGDYFTVEYAPGNTIPIEFDLSPGDGTTGGRVAYVFAAGDTADQIRDGLIALLNAAAPTALTASSGGAATVAIVLDTPGAVGGTNSEAVADAGFAVTGFVNPTAATTYTYSLQACLADGTCNAAGPASTTAAGHATLSVSNLNRLTWSAVPGAASYKIRRDVGGASQGVIWSGTALTVDDTGLAGDGTGKPADDGTGSVTAGNYGTLVKTKNVTIDGGALTLTPVAAPSAPTLTATVAGTKPAGTWNGKVTWVTATGETALGTVSANITVDGSKAITVARPADPPSVATGWKWYSSKQGPTAAWYVTSATIPIATLTYNDNAADAALLRNATAAQGSAGYGIFAGSTRVGLVGNTNVAQGPGALGLVEEASEITGVGYLVLGALVSGKNAVGLGAYAGRNATTGGGTFIGTHSGYLSGATPSSANAATTSTKATFVGYGTGLGSATQRTNVTAIGYGAYVDADNTVVLGDGAVTDVLAGSTGLARVTQGEGKIQTVNGAAWYHGSVSELITLSTAGTTTDSTAFLLPANSIIEAVVARVTTTITTATDWKLGDPTTAGRFTAANSTLTAGTTVVGLVHVDQAGAAGPRQTTAAKLRVTTTGTPGAGVIRVTVFYRQFTPPAS